MSYFSCGVVGTVTKEYHKTSQLTKDNKLVPELRKNFGLLVEV